MLATRDVASFSDVLPASLRYVCDTLLESFSQCHTAPAWVQVSETCGATEPVHSVLIRGFGLRGAPHAMSARIVIVLEERSSRDATAMPVTSPAPHVRDMLAPRAVHEFNVVLTWR